MTGILVDLLFSALIPVVLVLHLSVAPYTKVEESFNIQAVHDVLTYGTPLRNVTNSLATTYDHFTFPGAVPRTFVGPVLLAGVTQPFIAVCGPNWTQFIVRLFLAVINAAALRYFQINLEKAFGRPTARWYVLLQATQFHVMFYASRTLPNMFAFPLTTVAFANLLPANLSRTGDRQRYALTAFVFAAVVFRSEILLLIITTFGPKIFTDGGTLVENFARLFYRLALPGIFAFAVAVTTSFALDSYFWQRPLWPELSGFWYNAVKGKSSDWGVSPFWWYFTHALPRMLAFPLLLSPIAFIYLPTRQASLSLSLPNLLYVLIYSFQPHKETRFIFYVVPPLTSVAAMGANRVWMWATADKLSRPLAPLYRIGGILYPVSIVLLGFASSIFMLGLSSLNYPGGEALTELSKLIAVTKSNVLSPPLYPVGQEIVPIHADVLSCMTGITLFGINAASEYAGTQLLVDRTEDLDVMSKEQFWDKFSWALAEDPEPILGSGRKWKIVAVVKGFAGIEYTIGSRNNWQVDNSSDTVPVVGRGRLVETFKKKILDLSSGRFWVGPRMKPQVYILRRGESDDIEWDASERRKIKYW